MIVRPWEAGDTEKLMFQPAQAYMTGVAENVDLKPLSDQGLAWTGEIDGDPIVIAGLAPQWEGRAVAWALLSENAGRHFLRIHKEVEKKLIHAPFRRIEATVDIGFKAGHRWVEMLGFELEGCLRAYSPEGKDQIMYSRIRRWPFSPQ